MGALIRCIQSPMMLQFLGGELARPPYVMATDATNVSTSSPHHGSSKLLTRHLKTTGQRRPSFCDATRPDRVTTVATGTHKVVILGISNDAPLTYRRLVGVISI